MSIQLTLALVAWHAVRQRRFVIVVLAVSLHALTDLPVVLYQVYVLPLAVIETIYAAATVLLVVTCRPLQGGRKVGESSLC